MTDSLKPQGDGSAPRTVLLVQARMGSTRLPGKVLAPLGGRPLLELVLERARAAPGVDEVAVATSDLERDDPVVQLAQRVGVTAIRGSEQDVLDRFHGAAVALRADTVVRVTADCPLVDPQLIGRVVAYHHASGQDYTALTVGTVEGNDGRRRFADGLDTEVVAASALAAAWREATDPYDREHVTPFVKARPERFAIGWLEADEDFGDERWTVDRPDDLAFVRAVVDRLGAGPFGHREVLALLEREPQLRRARD
jgi:spore coat polysaccharide biosynthesis protein SpsF